VPQLWVSNSGWTAAQRRAARLSIENCKTRRGRMAHPVTAPYSAAQVESQISNAEKARNCVPQVPRTVDRACGRGLASARFDRNEPDKIGGKGGTRTLDPGIMRAVPGQ
jgi:hypothetical protein